MVGPWLISPPPFLKSVVTVWLTLRPTHGGHGSPPSPGAASFASHASVCFLLVLRTLVGHKANICSLDFHPYGEFVASGSQDTNIKVRPRTGPRVSRWPGSGTGPCVRPERVGVSSLSAAAALLLKIPSFNESSLDPCHLGCNDLEVPRALLCSQPHTALQPGPQDGPGSRPPQPQPPLVVTCSDSAPLLLSPQLWDIRRKGCVFRYRVRKAPLLVTTQAWSMGSSQAGRGRRGLLASTVRTRKSQQET